jgi:glycosyltransferase involved in cell wall biosynthesis
MKLISLVVPCYNEEASIPLFYEAVTETFETIENNVEIIFVDDGSSDRTFDVIKELAERDERVLYLSLARNFGKESAIYAGLCNSSGDYVAVMDADLQDPPSLLPEMISVLDSGEYDCVTTRRNDREGEPPVRSWFAKRFYKFINKYSDAEILDGARDFRLMTRDVTDAIISMGEYNRFSKGIFAWVGFRTYWLSYANIPRAKGQTKWSFRKLMRYAIDGIISFSNAPLHLASYLGVFMTGLSLIALVFIIVRKLMFGDPVAGWPSLTCIIILIGGIQLAILGIIGEYLAKTYMETKGRPIFIIRESNKDDCTKVK